MSLEKELQDLKCLAVAVAGTNGKSTTASLLEWMLSHAHRRTMVCSRESRPVSAVPNHGAELDFLVFQAEASEVENSTLLRPAVSVLLNLTSHRYAGYATPEDYARAYAPLFSNQQFFDWAVIQSQALERLRQLNIPIPAKTITFSASDPTADLVLDRGLLVSRLPNWPGPLLDLAHCMLRGPHHAEDLLATLAVGHALRLPLESMVDSLKTFHPGPHRFESLGEINGVQFIDDAKACNLDALQGALQAVRPGLNGQPNVWLIAGGQDNGQDFHDAGPLISKRVKGAFVIGEASQKIRLAWSLFTPCMQSASLLEAVAEAAKNATSGDVVLLSPACSGLDQFRNYQHRGEMFCEIVKSIGGGQLAPSPHMSGPLAPASL